MTKERFDLLLYPCAEGRVERAKTLSFALVTAYDHEIADGEVNRYVQLVGGHADSFRALATAMKAELDEATDWTRGELGEMHDIADEVIHAARVAMISDSKLRPREEVALNIVAVALGLDPNEV